MDAAFVYRIAHPPLLWNCSRVEEEREGPGLQKAGAMALARGRPLRPWPQPSSLWNGALLPDPVGAARPHCLPPVSVPLSWGRRVAGGHNFSAGLAFSHKPTSAGNTHSPHPHAQVSGFGGSPPCFSLPRQGCVCAEAGGELGEQG